MSSQQLEKAKKALTFVDQKKICQFCSKQFYTQREQTIYCGVCLKTGAVRKAMNKKYHKKQVIPKSSKPKLVTKTQRKRVFKEATREEIEEQTANFLNKGGKVKVVKLSVKEMFAIESEDLRILDNDNDLLRF